MSSPSPYRPPQAAVADPERPRGSPLKAVTFGALVDLGGSIVAAFVIMFVYGVWLGASGAGGEEIERALGNVEPGSTVSLIGYAVGTGFSWLGGYVCARVVGHDELKWAGVVAAISCSVGLAMGSSLSWELNMLLLGLTLAAVLFGGWVGARRNARQP